ncbi:MAG: phospholipase D family protein [Syntrophus sp. (in: bacteria)]|nr:phospholipase D family protein [Syntrophus sp. (in: bacteria)]
MLPYTGVNGAELTLDNTPAKVCFSPDGGCTKNIVKEIEMATREVLVQAYSFTSAPIRNALIGAQRRGVSIEVLLDKVQQKDQKFKAASAFSKGRIAVYIDDKHSSAHNKVIIIDRETVITGSFNFTFAAENKNAENILIIKSQRLAGLYADNWLSHRQHSQKY